MVDPPTDVWQLSLYTKRNAVLEPNTECLSKYIVLEDFVLQKGKTGILWLLIFSPISY